jgi:hypothetical protein
MFSIYGVHNLGTLLTLVFITNIATSFDHLAFGCNTYGPTHINVHMGYVV